MPALGQHAQQVGGHQLAEMAAGGLRGDPGDQRQFLGGAGAAIHQGAQDIGAGGIAEQGGDGGELWLGAGHDRNSRPARPDGAIADASVATEPLARPDRLYRVMQKPAPETDRKSTRLNYSH